MGSKNDAEKIANFSFLRAIRKMPKLRMIDTSHIVRVSQDIKIEFPDSVIDNNTKLAVFDGGLIENHPFGDLVNQIEPSQEKNIGSPVKEYQEHGTHVTSAALFGHIKDLKPERPYSKVDHYRVLGDEVKDKNLYGVMLYVDEVLSQSNYDMASFSFGPYETVDDNEVTAWTTMLDDHFGEGDTLGLIAVGNDGNKPWPSSRIQVPSDCVNALSIGASDDVTEGWSRAPYSSYGPGRQPGFIKPDLVSFGGILGNEFNVVSSNNSLEKILGTSFSTPSVARQAAGLKAYFGNDLSPMAVKALLIHTADKGNNETHHVGWGRVEENIDQIVTCGKGVVRILYQGKLEPGKVLRAPIPLPEEKLNGMINIRATFCYGCKTDPNTPGEYTRAGLNIRFRPNKNKFGNDPNYPDTKPFFSKHDNATEQELRHEAHKWDTVRHNEKRMNSKGLVSPVFDIHYIARAPGVDSGPKDASKLSYSLIITVESKHTPDLYNLVKTRYQNQLSPIIPKIDIPVKAKV